jgi:hypothetical protein
MSIQVTPIPRLTTLTTPAFTLGVANAAGDAITAVSSNSTLLAFDTTLPAATGTSAVGAATVAPRRDHVHASTGAATQAEQEAGTSTAAYTSPGTQEFHQSACKGWAKTVKTGGVSASYNVASMTKNATGDYTIAWTVDFSTVNYAFVGMMAGENGAIYGPTGTQAAATMRFLTQSSSHANSDTEVYCVAFGDQ